VIIILLVKFKRQKKSIKLEIDARTSVYSSSELDKSESWLEQCHIKNLKNIQNWEYRCHFDQLMLNKWLTSWNEELTRNEKVWNQSQETVQLVRSDNFWKITYCLKRQWNKITSKREIETEGKCNLYKLGLWLKWLTSWINNEQRHKQVWEHCR
jgi:hypothetical protein